MCYPALLLTLFWRGQIFHLFFPVCLCYLFFNSFLSSYLPPDAKTVEMCPHFLHVTCVVKKDEKNNTSLSIKSTDRYTQQIIARQYHSFRLTLDWTCELKCEAMKSSLRNLKLSGGQNGDLRGQMGCSLLSWSKKKSANSCASCKVSKSDQR